MKPPTVFLGEMTTPRSRRSCATTGRSSCRSARPSSTARTARCCTDVLDPDRGRPSHRAAGGRRRRPDGQLRAVVSARRLHRRRPRPDPDLHGADRGPVRRRWRRSASAGSCSSTATTTTRTRSPTPARTRRDRLPAGVARLPGQLLGRDDAGRGRRVLRSRRTASTPTGARRPRCSRSTPRSSTWSSPTPRCRRSPR